MLVRMTSTNDAGYDTDLLETLSQRVVVGDGAIGTQLQAADLTLDDFNNRADAVKRNTFGCNLVNLSNYDIADKIRQLALKGTAIAKRVGSS
jgi:5-methyltetrahydrofolate--homocysteine methyltransferase